MAGFFLLGYQQLATIKHRCVAPFNSKALSNGLYNYS
jgi:hypothetical protein